MKKSIISLLAVFLLLPLLGTSVVYATESIPKGTEKELEDVEKNHGAESNEEIQEEIQKGQIQEEEIRKEQIPKKENAIFHSKAEEAVGQSKTENASDGVPEAHGTNENDIVQNNTKRTYGWHWDPGSNRWYFYNHQGNRITGWLEWGNKWYYFDKNHSQFPGVMLAGCKKQIGKETYFFAADGTMQTGWVKRKEGWYYTNQSGVMQTGWKKIGNTWYYMDPANRENPGLMVANGEYEIESQKYFFDRSGAMLVGWVWRPEGWYYTNGSGRKVSGWHQVGGKWYYMDPANRKNPGLMVANGEYKIGNQKYFFDRSGAMLVGWVWRPEGWYYTDGSGRKISGWYQVGGKWYYMDPANRENPGLMVASGEHKIGGRNYLFDKSGVMMTGWIWKSGNWRYYDEYSGQPVSGWRLVGGKWYYMNPAKDNIMMSGGRLKIGGLWYYFNSDGTMATGWHWAGGRWYYLGSDGGARTGWKVVDGDWYYFYTANDSHGGPEGAMASNVKIDGWQLTSSGAMVSTAEMKMNARAQVYSSNTKYLILVDRSACKVAIYTGWSGSWNRVKYWSCSPGKPSTPTVAGTFKIGSRGRYFDSGSSRCYWYTQFKGNYLFHSVLYSRNGTINDGRLGMQLSHGCVRLDINNAKWIYDNIPTGTTVVVY